MSTTTPGGRRRRAAAAAFGLLTLLGVALLVWTFTHQVGDPPAPDPNAARPATTASSPSAPDPDEAAATGGAGVQDGHAARRNDGRGPEGANATAKPVRPAAALRQPDPTQHSDRSAKVEPLPASKPVRVRIPAIDVTSELHPLGLNPDGTLQVPSGDRYDQAAWYDGSPTPGQLGGAVIEGHVTSQGSTPSVFYELGALAPGDRVHVDRADATTTTFEIYGVESFPKDDFPKVAVYGNTQTPELRLITCGGLYDPDQRRHVDNIVVFARMVDAH